MALPSEADLAQAIVDDFKDVSSDFNDQGSDVHNAVRDGLATALARTIRRVLLDELEALVASGTMTGEDSAGDTPDTLAATVTLS